ncbi:MAG: class I SAM-dependent methyltransferase [Candidatus Hydrothermarchaeales archaeon]
MVKERYFDKVSKNYDFYTKILMLGTYDRVRDRIIKPGNTDEQRALDLCCGTGYLTGGIKAEQVVGLDLSQGMLKFNKQKNREPSLLRGDAFNLPFAGDGFDSVYCSLATHEFRDILPILTEAHRVLRDGGKLIIFDIFKPSFPLSWFFIMFLVKYLAELGRMWVYTQNEWESMLRSVGFKEVRIDVLYTTAVLIRAVK